MATFNEILMKAFSGLAGWSSTNGAAHVRALGSPGSLETRTVLFDAEADGVAFSTGVLTVAAANLITLNSFLSGKKRARLTFHAADGGIPFIPFVLVTLNASDDTTATSRLTVTPTQENGTGSADTRHRVISQMAPVIEYNLEGTDSTIDRIDMVGVASNLTGTADVLVSVEVW